MTTQEAFEKMLADPSLKKVFNKSTRGSWKKRLKENGKIAQHFMEEALRKSGMFTEKPVEWEPKK